MSQEVNLTRMIERKAESHEVKQLGDEKMNKAEAHALFVLKQDFGDLKLNSDALLKTQQDFISKHRK